MTIRAATWPSGTRITWRSLTWGEYRDVRGAQGPPAEKALQVYTLCLLDGPGPDQVPAGIMMWLYQDSLEKSPFSGSFQSLSGPLQWHREKVTNTYLLCAQALIASVLRVPFEVMDTWDAETFFTRVAQAEFIAGVPLNPVDPTAVASPQRDKVKPPKKAFTPAQQTAIERVKDDRNNPRSTKQVGRRPQGKH
jgi:hypothetical protein